MKPMRNRIGWLVCRPELTEKLRAKGIVREVTDRCEDEDGIWETVHFVKGVEEEGWAWFDSPEAIVLFKDNIPVHTCTEVDGICSSR